MPYSSVRCWAGWLHHAAEAPIGAARRGPLMPVWPSPPPPHRHGPACSSGGRRCWDAELRRAAGLVDLGRRGLQVDQRFFEIFSGEGRDRALGKRLDDLLGHARMLLVAWSPCRVRLAAEGEFGMAPSSSARRWGVGRSSVTLLTESGPMAVGRLQPTLATTIMPAGCVQSHVRPVRPLPLAGFSQSQAGSSIPSSSASDQAFQPLLKRFSRCATSR